jgi:hypothetical protein
MGPREGNTVLMAAAYGPIIAIRVGLQYLRIKRKANKARGRFYNELVRGGVPREQAAELADEYAGGLSIRSFFKAGGMGSAFSRWDRGE